MARPPSTFLIDTHPHLLDEWDFQRNREIFPDITTVGSQSNKRVWWTCRINYTHSWFATINSRSHGGKGCRFCSNKVVSDQNRLTLADPDLAAEWHPTKNLPLAPCDVSFGSNKEVWWICKKSQHAWKASTNSRRRGSGCPFCSGKRACDDNCLAILRPDLASQWDYEKNAGLTPYNFTCGSHKIVGWICKNLHRWSACIKNRALLGRGCPRCKKSLGEERIAEWLTLFGENYERQFTFEDCRRKRRLPFDFYLPARNLCIEFDGYQHFWPIPYGPEELLDIQERDRIKTLYCETHNIPLLRISYLQYNEIDKLLNDEILKEMRNGNQESCVRLECSS